MKNSSILTVLIVLLIVPYVSGYELILKNGKVIRGTLVSEDDEKFTIKDADGVTLNFKKNLVDLEKTKEANQPAEAPAVEPLTVKKEKKEPAKPKKKAKVYDQSDVERLRSEYPMESGAGVTYDEAEPLPEKKGRSGEEWQEITGNLLAAVKQAEAAYSRLSAKCKEFQNATIQTHIAIDHQGKPTDLVEAKERACQNAEDAKGAVERARQQHAGAVQQARQENIPPGYIVTE